jgi:probable O-glycosylation ligase (exosortase A-associated)
MRGTIVMILAGLAIPLAFISPFVGLMAYCWLSYMRPQDMAFGIGHITFGLYTAAALFAGLLFKLRFQFFRWHPVTWIFLGLWSWWAWCTYNAYDRDAAMDGLVQISRIFIVCLVTTGLCTTKHRLKWVVVAISGSLLFHGTKLGLYGIATGGAKQLNPIGGLMSGNNENAIALSIGLPFAVHFAVEAKEKWRRIAMWSVTFLTAIAVVLTYSRGGFLGLAAAAGVLVWHSRARWFAIFVAVPVLVGAFLTFAPSDYTDRINGIGDASKSDRSAQMRLEAWSVAATITAEHPIQGIGPKNFHGQSKRFPRPSTMVDMEVHNTYLELAASMGLTGLLGYLVLVTASWVTASRVRREARLHQDPRLRWFGSTATAIQAAMTAFLVSSFFGSLAHYDLMYHLCALAVCLPAAYRHEADRIDAEDTALLDAERDVAARGPAPEAAWASAVPTLPLSRYDERPVLETAPPGLPDFRHAAAVAVVVAPAAAAAEVVPQAAAPETAPSADDVRLERHGPPARHTLPEGPREDVALDASTLDLEDMFIDPYGTTCVQQDEYLDTGSAPDAEPPAPPRRPARSGSAARPWLSPLEERALERPRAARPKEEREPARRA